MLATVDLDDKALLKRSEVDNVMTDWRLLADVKSKFFQST
jgi:hypothetical protein